MAIRKCPLETLELMIVESLPLSGLKKIKRSSFSDHRGFFSRLFCEKTLKAAGFIKPVSQINHSLTLKKGSIRGLHAQRPPHSEMKLVTCLCSRHSKKFTYIFKMVRNRFIRRKSRIFVNP